MTEEKWLPVVGYEEYFLVSETGRIFSKRTNKELKLNKTKRGGYLSFTTRFGGRKSKTKLFKVHILVCEAFNGPRPNEEQIYALHWDDNKLNNHYSNLRWGSIRENTEDAIRNNKLKNTKRKIYRGEENKLSKLKDDMVKEILNNFSSLELSSRWQKICHYAVKFGVSKYTIRAIVNGKKWKHLTNGLRLS